jgi:hypothetical protein
MYIYDILGPSSSTDTSKKHRVNEIEAGPVELVEMKEIREFKTRRKCVLFDSRKKEIR